MILIIILNELIAEGTGEWLPNRLENTGATLDTGENKHRIIIFLISKSVGKIKNTNNDKKIVTI